LFFLYLLRLVEASDSILLVFFLLWLVSILAFPAVLKNAFYDTNEKNIFFILETRKNKLPLVIKEKVHRIRIILRWRGSRVIITIGRIILSIVFLIFLSIGLAAIVNALELKKTFTQTRAFTGTRITPSTYSLLIDGNGTLYAGTYGSVFRSTDEGQTWQAASAGLPSAAINALLQDSRDGTLYAGTVGGIFRSTDGGQTWKTASEGLPNTHKINALLQDSRDGTLYAGTEADILDNGGGVFRSTDGGQTWQNASVVLPSTGVKALLQDSRDGTLYAGTGREFGGLDEVFGSMFEVRDGVFRSTDGGQTWQTASKGLPKTHNIIALLQDSRDGTLYAGTEAGFFGYGGGIFRSTDGGQTWKTASEGLPNTHKINALLQDSRDGTLYAGTEADILDNGGGVFRSTDGGQTWKNTSPRLPSTDINALLQDSRDGTLYAGTVGGIFRSTDGGQTWYVPNSAIIVNSLLQDSRNGILYARGGGGVFRSTDGGQTWQTASTGLTGGNVNTLLQDSRDGTLYAGTGREFGGDGGGVFRSTDGGQTWKNTSPRLPSAGINALLQDSRDGTFYAGTVDGVFRSTDGGQTWQTASEGLPNTHNIIALLQDSRDGTLYAGTYGSVFRSTDGGQTWQAARVGLPSRGVTSLVQDSRDGTLYAGDGSRTFRSADGGQTWTSVGFADHYVAYENMPEWIFYYGLTGAFADTSSDIRIIWVLKYQQQRSDVKHYYTFDIANLAINSELETTSGFRPFWALRTWTELWFKPRWHYFAGGGALALAIWGLVTYGSAVWALRIHPLKFSRAKAVIQDYFDGKPAPPVLEKCNKRIHDELVMFGDVIPDDLLSVPMLLRKPVLNAYLARHGETYALQPRGRGLVLIAGKPLREWNTAWRSAAYDFERHQGLSQNGQAQVNRLAQAFCDMLGFSLGEQRESLSLCAWQVEASALRLNLPERFPLIFLADHNPNAETVRKLIDTVSLFNGKSNFSLVVPLEMPNPDADLPQVLRRLVDVSPYAHDFIVLSHQDVIEILIARHPERMLVRHISRQMDLDFISPFIINGPVPPQMFFGREKEIRTLVDYAGKRNFAVVGNRKIGKTSLLNQVDFRLSEPGTMRLLRMDCQAIRDSAEFLSAFQKSFMPKENIDSPAALASSLRAMKKQSAQPLVLMLDEVDSLLATEKAGGESLLAVWRELANEHTCAFIFCGSKILVRQLRDPESALFNFPETLSLTYLNRSEMDEVITRPLETLGIGLQDAGAVLGSAWALTSGHPNLTQFVGRALVNAANENPERQVGPQAVEDTSVDPDFIKFYFDTVWGAATPLEKCITLLMPPENFGVGDVEQALSGAGIPATPDEVDAALDTLQAYAVLGRSGKLYHFIPQAFHQLLEANYEKERLLAREKSKLNGDGA
jgi:photosystem II stability/assembly factor-like uncharacterized protein